MSEQKKEFKVICTSVGGKGNKIHCFGDIIPEDCLYEKQIPDLIKYGSIELVVGKTKAKSKTK